jgi:hypothetical protein
MWQICLISFLKSISILFPWILSLKQSGDRFSHILKSILIGPIKFTCWGYMRSPNEQIPKTSNICQKFHLSVLVRFRICDTKLVSLWMCWQQLSGLTRSLQQFVDNDLFAELPLCLFDTPSSHNWLNLSSGRVSKEFEGMKRGESSIVTWKSASERYISLLLHKSFVLT